MKSIKTLLVLIIFFTSHLLSAQTKEEYLSKSKRQKTAALIMIIGGTVTATAGIVSAVAGSVDRAFGSPGADRGETASSILAITGAAAILGSIPMIVASGKNKKRAMNLTLTNQPIPAIVSIITKQRSLPSIALRFSL